MKSTEEWNKDKEIESLRHEIFHAEAEIQQLYSWIKSDSVYTLLRYVNQEPKKEWIKVHPMTKIERRCAKKIRM